MDKLTDIVKNVPTPKLNVNSGKAASNIGKATSNTMKVVGNTTKKIASSTVNSLKKVQSFLSSKSPIAYIIMGLIFIILILLVIYLTQNLLMSIYSNSSKKTILLNGTKDATEETTITQDPSLTNSITVPRSENEDGGIEFTYSFWMYVNNWINTNTSEQHVFHKGEKKGEVNFAPKVTLDGTENKMYIYMNTFDTQEVKLEIDNLPVKKWMNVCIVVKHKVIDIYVNGFLKRTHTFDSIPKQNYRNVYINMPNNGTDNTSGYDGYFSTLVYYKYALDYYDIQGIMNSGPSKTLLVTDVNTTFSHIPPYFASDWWNE